MFFGIHYLFTHMLLVLYTRIFLFNF
jgi:hypothetical protein